MLGIGSGVNLTYKERELYPAINIAFGYAF